MHNFRDEFHKTNKELSDIYTSVNGDVAKVREFLENKTVVRWTPLEDLALTEPETSVEF